MSQKLLLKKNYTQQPQKKAKSLHLYLLAKYIEQLIISFIKKPSKIKTALMLSILATKKAELSMEM